MAIYVLVIIEIVFRLHKHPLRDHVIISMFEYQSGARNLKKYFEAYQILYSYNFLKLNMSIR